MSQSRIEKAVQALAEPIAEELNYELVDLEFKKESGSWYLRFYIDKPGGITLDDCQIFSECISDKLDETDPIPHRYYLEVSSPGLDRPLKRDKDFVRFKGRKVHVKLYKAVNGMKNYYGELIGLEEGKVVIRDKDQIHAFPRQDIAVVRLVIDI
ncbi:MAG: ribosome maturation factor RimP [Clostridiales bacterium]|jgi:ribosome maturation factor RimP|nr:ribosome maturation factor RimP [Clostridiales bacterium]